MTTPLPTRAPPDRGGRAGKSCANPRREERRELRFGDPPMGLGVALAGGDLVWIAEADAGKAGFLAAIVPTFDRADACSAIQSLA